MRRLLKSQNHLMNFLGFVLIFGFISLGAIGGCSDNNGGDQVSAGARTALTENDFWKDPGLVANPDEHIIVKFLEHPESEGHENDTGEVGHDVIPHTYTRTLEHTFCWDDDDEALHFMELDDLDGKEILRVEANGECVTAVIEAGDYVMTIWHDGKVFKNHAVFIRHGHNENLRARGEGTRSGGTLERSGSFYSIILAKLNNIIALETTAQTVADNIETLITTNSCIGCDLSGADLSGQELIGVDLTGADLTGVDFTRVNLMNTIFSNATWCDGSCMCGDNSIDECLGCASIDTCIASDEVEITLVNNCDQTIWAITENIAGNPRWEMNSKGCKSDDDCKNNNTTGGICNTNTGNCERVVQVPYDCSSCKIWPATGCTFERDFECPAAISEFCCATGGVIKPLSPVTVAEFTFQAQKTPPENDFYDVSIIDGYNVGIEMFPLAEKTTFLPPPNQELKNYWCQNAGGPVYGSTNPTPDCGKQGQPPCSNLNPKADCLWEDFFGPDCGGQMGLRVVKPKFVAEAQECLDPAQFKDVGIGKVCTCTDDSQCPGEDQICGLGNSKTVPNKMCGELAGCENAKSLCGIGQYFEGRIGGNTCGQENKCASGTCLTDPKKTCGTNDECNSSFPGAVCKEGMCQCVPNVCNADGKCTNDSLNCSNDSDCKPTCNNGLCTPSPVDFANCREKFPQTLMCEKTSDCPLLGGLKYAPGECSLCPDETECVRLDAAGNIGCQMKCESNMCKSLSCGKDSDCLRLNNKDTGIFMLCDTSVNQCVATTASMLGGTGVNGQSCTNPTNFQGCSTDADCLELPECNQPNANCKCGVNKFCVIGNKNVGRYNAATKLCSGCTDTLEQEGWVLPPTKACTEEGPGDDDTTGDCGGSVCSNENWIGAVVPLIKNFKMACPTTYVFPFDDTTATFQCRKPAANNLKYRITFCPSR